MAENDQSNQRSGDEESYIESDHPEEKEFEFALSPAMAYNGIIDYSTTQGRKMYSAATAKLSEDLYDCNAEDLYTFLKALKERAREYGWDTEGVGIMSIPDNPEDPKDFKSLINNHGEIDIESIKAFEESYVEGKSRSAQDAAMLYRCLMNSISKEGKKKILVWEDQYQVGTYGSGNLLLKIVVRESHLDTNATSASIRKKLTNLDRYLPTIGQDITKFNTYVKLLTDGLQSRGEVTNNLLINLFKGYSACSDREFIEYIKRKEDAFEEGKEITPDQLMKYADEKYKTLLQKGTWNAPDANEEKILALQVEINKLKSKSSKAKKTGKNKSSGKKQSSTGNKKPAWFQQRPIDSELKKPKEWNGIKWYYCHKDTGGKCDGKWRRHKPSSCKGKAYVFPGKQNQEKETENPKRKYADTNYKQNSDRVLKLKKGIEAASAVIESNEESSSSEE